jgi:long-chain acyl-CoA synthetase
MPETIAAVLRSHPAVSDAAVVGFPDDRLGEVPVAAIELKAGQSYPGDDALKAHLRSQLTAMHIPTRFVTIDALPRTPSMKVSLVEVKKLFGH